MNVKPCGSERPERAAPAPDGENRPETAKRPDADPEASVEWKRALSGNGGEPQPNDALRGRAAPDGGKGAGGDMTGLFARALREIKTAAEGASTSASTSAPASVPVPSAAPAEAVAMPGPGVSAARESALPSPAASASRCGELVERILVSRPSAGDGGEVRIKLDSSWLPDTEVRIARPAGGGLSVEFVSDHVDAQRFLLPNLSELRERLSERGGEPVALRMSEHASDGGSRDGRSRERRNLYEEMDGPA